MTFETKQLARNADVVAPDGCEVRILGGLAGGGMAHFQLAAGECSIAVQHRTVDEIWYFVAGRGEMWRRDREHELVVAVGHGTCVTIPLGTAFQVRALGNAPLRALAVTMPPWPGDGEAVRVEGRWPPTVAAGPGLAS
jgi:mannose-6-phosphate isomerase-like protein (cupin superfamily)